VVRVFVSGLLMGIADTIPGVSGGTVAMVLGFYDRLVTAISRCDATLLRLVVGGHWREASERLDLRFLLTLSLGIGSGILGLATLMRGLLREYPLPVNAVFFGLVAGSCLLVGRGIGGWTKLRAALVVVAFVVAFELLAFPEGSIEPSGGRLELFASGAIAICAMILPGVSGAFLLKVMGQYEGVINLLAELAAGRATFELLVTLAVFACGCLAGLIGFSKLLRRLLDSHRESTLAVLTGAMCGSLRVLWPLGEGDSGAGSSTGLLVVLMVVSFAGVVMFERVTRRGGMRESSEDREQQQPAGSD
jgi:putative membrane protein